MRLRKNGDLHPQLRLHSVLHYTAASVNILYDLTNITPFKIRRHKLYLLQLEKIVVVRMKHYDCHLWVSNSHVSRGQTDAQPGPAVRKCGYAGKLRLQMRSILDNFFCICPNRIDCNFSPSRVVAIKRFSSEYPEETVTYQTFFC